MIVEFREIIHGKETRRQRIRLPPKQVIRTQTLTFDKHVFCVAHTSQKMMAYFGHYSETKKIVSSVPSILQDSFKDTFTSIHNQVFQSGLPNFQYCRLKIPSTFDIELWRGSLVSYNDSIIVDFLEYSWPVSYTKLEFPVISYRNHKSALFHEHRIDSYTETELG